MQSTIKYNWGNCYTLDDYTGVTNFWIYKNDDGNIYKMHIQNYKKSDFAKDFKIVEDPEYTYKILKNTIKCRNFEELLQNAMDPDDDNIQKSIAMAFFHILITRCL